ncbi:MAG: hypothetical protein KF782_04050 [Labilithrix sp.]|nr:hypothetical protein [Labilithrix sp.]
MWPLLLGALATAAPDPRDTDGDGIPDVEEDTNHNGVVDPGESDPRSADTDHDNVPDAVERELGTDPRRASDVPPIPEPLYIDLIRNLGSGRGELEANVLATTSFDAVAWAPEIEYTPLPGFGLELELPLRNGELEAIKGGAQATLGSIDTRRLEVGALGIYEHSLDGRERRASLTAVTGVRFSHMLQGLVIVGPTVDFGPSRPAPGATLHPSLFAQASRYFTAGVELGYRVARDERTVATVLPQVHVNPLSQLKVQLGMGVNARVGLNVRPLAALRVSVEH